jgi:hypothetical protein
MSKLVFLGGTAANNGWRIPFIDTLVAMGADPNALFNPVVSEWDNEAQQREEEAKARATHLVFYIADPKQEGYPLSAYSMVEATMALYDKSERAVVVFDTAGVVGHPLKAMKQTAKVLRKRFPRANIFATLEEARDWLAKELVN